MAPIDSEQARDLLFGDTDVRELMLFVAQQGHGMDPVERDQRLKILEALSVHRTSELAVQTAQLAQHTQRLASWTRWMALATFIVAAASIAAVVGAS